MIEQGCKTPEEVIMKLWLLTPGPNKSAWDGWDTAQKFVIRAETEDKARGYADTCGGEETVSGKYDWQGLENHPWLDPKQSTCVELLVDGWGEVISAEYNWG